MTVWSLLALIVFLPIAPLTNIKAAGNYNGTVFRDFDWDGAPDALDAGIAGVTVRMFNAANASCVTTSDAAGAWSIDTSNCNGGAVLNGTGGYRVEFSGQPSYLHNTVVAAGAGNSNSSERFVADGGATGINVGYSNPRDYLSNQTNPRIAMTNFMYPGADTDRTSSSAIADNALFSFDYTNSGSVNSGAPAATFDVTAERLGTTWGVAQHRPSGRLFAAAALKRHHDLGNLVRPVTGGADSAVNVDGIYMINYPNGGAAGGSYVGGFLLNGVVPSSGDAGTINTGNVTRRIQTGLVGTGAANANALSTDTTTVGTGGLFSGRMNYDVDAFLKVGATGFGAAAMQEDEQALWVVNLNQRSLIRINTANAAALPTSGAISGALVQNWAIPTTGCVNGEARPWGLKMRDGAGYVGVVCDAITSQNAVDLSAQVLRFDPANMAGGFTSVVSFPLNYNRENSSYAGDDFCGAGSNARWNPWLDADADGGVGTTGEFGCPQPILSNIEFAENGDLILGFLDRFGMMLDVNYTTDSSSTQIREANAGGDIVHVCNNAGTFAVEGSAGCAIDQDNTLNTTSREINDGPNDSGEFYYTDSWLNISNVNQGHNETTLGGLALKPGTGEIIGNTYDPINEFSQGVKRFRTRNGLAANQGQLTNSYEPVFGNVPNRISKGTGLGDLEILSNPAPVEIGNRVWNDETNPNGRQDPGEAVFAGVRVELWMNLDADVELEFVGFTTTDANGNYLFSSAAAGAATGALYNVTQLQPNTAFELRIPKANYPTDHLPTMPDAVGDVRDSDGVASFRGASSDIFSVAAGTTGNAAGANNHSYDFGFVPAPTAADLVLSGTAVDTAGRGIAGATVQLLDTETGEVRKVITDKAGDYRFSGINSNSFVIVSVLKSNFSFAPPQLYFSMNDSVSGVQFVGTQLTKKPRGTAASISAPLPKPE